MAHKDVFVFDALLMPFSMICVTCTVGICHRTIANQRDMSRLPAIAVIFMAVRATACENVAAEFVLRLLRTRCRCGVDLVVTCLRCNREQTSDKSGDILRRHILQTVLAASAIDGPPPQ
jgi:hypothetical protein